MSEALKQDPEHAAHRRLPGEIERVAKHLEHFKAHGSAIDIAEWTQRLKHTQDRHPHALKAADLVDKLGLSHEVKPGQITYNDALNFVAKTLHEIQHGVATSNYSRAHAEMVRSWTGKRATNDAGEHVGLVTHVQKTENGKLAFEADGVTPVMVESTHVDLARHAAPRDPAAEVVEHLGLTDPAHVALVTSFFGKAQ